MADKISNPNIEWKKTDIGEQEKLSRRIDLVKATEEEAKKDSFAAKAPVQPKDLPIGLKKIKKKIRSLDDEEDEEEYQIVADPLLMEANNNSLFAALNEDEKKILKQQETNDIIKQQLQTEKLSAINAANNLAKQAGFNGLKKETFRQSTDNYDISANKMQDTLKKEFKKDINKKSDWSKLDDKELLELMQGINKIKEFEGTESNESLKDMDVKDVIAIGKNKKNDKKIARTICEKTGRKTFRDHKKDKKQEEKQLLLNKNKNKNYARDRERD